MKIPLQPLTDPNDLLAHKMFIVEITGSVFGRSPEYAICKLPDEITAFPEDGSNDHAEVIDLVNNDYVCAVSGILRWAPFEVE